MNLKNQQNIIGLVITKNEAHNISELIENLNFTDRIIIVDSFSTDQTADIAKKYPNVEVHQKEFENYADQRNFALSFARENWVLFIDADERVTEELKEEIKCIVNENKREIAYFFKRRFHYNKKPIYFCGLQTDKNIRLFYNAKGVHYKGFVHEKLQFTGTSQTLKNRLIHYSFEDFSSYKKKMYNYGILKAQDKFKQNKKAPFLGKYYHTAYTFLNKYFIRLGFLDGSKGLSLCKLMAYSVYVRYDEMERLQKNR